ncbi:tRNA (adenosine(37)-N6)-threonylcarbamoyltransferase complex dimerization subunit type 1 TsaB [Thermopetrobacter sp. TC1]|uniref:tRNA (adenosine(37)-N6)-threonylcarbamoyltransferase complex dimerization subunit type 1 TsaB n=1 Tax=Thermopetrobacter sp. TC1 TaxID=1495045 RepID=UPI00056EE93B|nr:tRNA (adenosine(37)-N6)-threonylcarbamoyltransferase complex dimerization subunit type 1 TsaB [Thermopetrobacter sp. TC1]
MLILGMDSCLQACSVALCDRASGQVLSHRREELERGHAEILPDMVDAVMMDAGDPYERLAFIAVTRGPGSFTGVRIGLSFARALGVTLEIPVTAMTTLEAIARNVGANPERLPVASVIDARRDEVYIQVFDADYAPLTDAMAVRADEAAAILPPGPCLLIGTGAEFLADEDTGRFLADASPLPDAEVVAMHSLVEPAPQTLPEPLYLRPPDAKPQGPLNNVK